MVGLSKKKYSELKEALEGKFTESKDIESALEAVCSVLKYDPEKGVYTPEQGQKNYARLKEKAKETGESTYVVTGRKKRYEKQKSKILKEEMSNE